MIHACKDPPPIQTPYSKQVFDTTHLPSLRLSVQAQSPEKWLLLLPISIITVYSLVSVCVATRGLILVSVVIAVRKLLFWSAINRTILLRHFIDHLQEVYDTIWK